MAMYTHISAQVDPRRGTTHDDDGIGISYQCLGGRYAFAVGNWKPFCGFGAARPFSSAGKVYIE